MKKKNIKNKIECAREVENWSQLELTDRFDKPKFDKDKLLNKLPIVSPKLYSLLQKIKELDKKDIKKNKKLYKHFIFSDIKKGYGAKIITSVLIAAGYNLVLKPNKGKIELNKEAIESGNSNNFIVLSSTALWNNKFDRKNVNIFLEEFNRRPENIYGNNIRFIIIDSGFKEGIDLFDVKYCHIFEQQKTNADLIQAIGRGTRNCGQSGLPYVKNKGWELEIYNYKAYLTFPKYIIFNKKKTLLDFLLLQNEKLNFTINFQNDLLNLIQENSVDNELNKNINKYQMKTWRETLKKGALITLAATVSLIAFMQLLKKRKKYINDIRNESIESFYNHIHNLRKGKFKAIEEYKEKPKTMYEKIQEIQRVKDENIRHFRNKVGESSKS